MKWVLWVLTAASSIYTVHYAMTIYKEEKNKLGAASLILLTAVIIASCFFVRIK